MEILVVDIGSGLTRCGTCGADGPSEIFPSTVGPVSDPVWPLVRGNVADWDAAEEHWANVFSRSSINSKESGVLLADSPTTLDKDRGRMAEILFEKFEVPSYFVGSQSVLSLYSAGRTSGVVVDIGYGVTHAMAVHEGFAFPHTIGQLELGGNDLARNVIELLNDRGVELTGAEGLAAAEAIVEEHGRVAMDYASEAFALRAKPEDAPRVSLPDGTELHLESEQIRCTEALFQPALAGCRGLGLTEMLWDIIEVCDADREGGPMRTLTQFVMMSGGGSMFPGLEERLGKELDARAKIPRDIYITAIAAPERHHAAWIGGSLLASLPQFAENNFIQRAEFEEEGVGAVHKRCV